MAVGAVEVVGACMRVHAANSSIVQEQAWFLLGALSPGSADVAAAPAPAAATQ